MTKYLFLKSDLSQTKVKIKFTLESKEINSKQLENFKSVFTLIAVSSSVFIKPANRKAYIKGGALNNM